MIELKNNNLGSTTLGIDSGGIGHADDLALLSVCDRNMQSMLNIVTSYSRRWRFEFGFDKCASLTFNSDKKPKFILCDKIIENRTEYVHVGIPITTSGCVSKKFIQKRVETCRRSFYSLVGCSMYKSTLSPCALSKIYFTAIVHKMLYGAETRVYSDYEINEYDSF